MLHSEKHRNSTAGPLVLRGDSSSNSGPSPSTASSFPFLFWLASRGKPLELEIQIPTAVGIQNSAILLVSASPITTAQAKACMSGASRRKFKFWFLTAICPCGFQPGSGWLFHGRRVWGGGSCAPRACCNDLRLWGRATPLKTAWCKGGLKFIEPQVVRPWGQDWRPEKSALPRKVISFLRGGCCFAPGLGCYSALPKKPDSGAACGT